MKFVLVKNLKMPIIKCQQLLAFNCWHLIVGIFKFITRTDVIVCCSKKENYFICFDIDADCKLYAQMS